MASRSTVSIFMKYFRTELQHFELNVAVKITVLIHAASNTEVMGHVSLLHKYPKSAAYRKMIPESVKHVGEHFRSDVFVSGADEHAFHEVAPPLARAHTVVFAVIRHLACLLLHRRLKRRVQGGRVGVDAMQAGRLCVLVPDGQTRLDESIGHIER